MDKKVEEASIDLVSLVNSHEKPFVVIDKNYRIMAVNSAYELEYGVASEDAVGQMCYQVSHGNDHPCSVEGEDCPHEQVFGTGKAKVCAHVHCDADHRMHHVKVSAFPLRGSNDELFLGECIEKISTMDAHIPGSERMVGESSEFIACVNQLNVAASSDAPVLLLGETGTGKELAARLLHTLSPRKDEPFLAVHCAALPESLLESELFGHEKGAFTGANKLKPGRFDLAGSGTLFFDEIGELEPSMQVKLLRVIQEREFMRVGGTRVDIPLYEYPVHGEVGTKAIVSGVQAISFGERDSGATKYAHWFPRHEDYEVRVADAGPFLVTGTVRDDHGALTLDARDILTLAIQETP